ncbi:hypothetical protein SAMN02745704_00457 [Paucidesulfovibrio gracilis DSM 16080]|uniref:Uncharacterized protein n=1 Tax=Paucidesulfovibrio gracilis DSM 16080 TaxID=1121449 RepID=A0A1T4W7R9_9BACT|nr:hypothetical protein [Paucidesulfovibrio gracilis]SKA73342.1 hypothetical protein SAMN02745704_00457 [Paucidesulfovibrio gracilis DSM 16080]
MSESETTPKLDKDQRLKAYLDVLERLRQERTSLREVLEREILLSFIRINRANLNEFPLLETQQRTVINLLCQRSDHPAYDYIHKLTGNFLVLLNRLSKAGPGEEDEKGQSTRSRLLNTETLLIKCMQGIIYANGLITDNFEELVLRNFGEAALPEYNQMLKEHELDRNFWQTFLERFVGGPVGQAHQEILANNRFHMNKEGNSLVVRFSMDDVLRHLSPSEKDIDKTRIQTAFEQRSRGYEGRRTLRLVTNCLARGLSFIPREAITSSDVESLARIACVDDVSQQFRIAYQERMQRREQADLDPDDETEHKLNFNFLMEQVVATGVGALIGVSQTRSEFSAALTNFIHEQAGTMQLLGKDLSLTNLQRVLSGVLEDHFLQRVRLQVENEGGIQVLKSRVRRSSLTQVRALKDKGLTRIRKNKLWRKDPANPEMLLFRVRNAAELAKLCRMLQLEPELLADVTRLWQAESFKVGIMLVVDLAAMSRRTTNLALRLKELLTRLGLVKPEPVRKEGEETPEADGTAENEDAPSPAPTTEQDEAAGGAEENSKSAPQEGNTESEEPSDAALEEGAAWPASPDADPGGAEAAEPEKSTG